MKQLQEYETRKGNKLIFKQQGSDIPALGSKVFSVLKETTEKSKLIKKKEIGNIIDVFGPVKNPWIVVNLNKDYPFDFTKNDFLWQKLSKFTKDYKKESKFGKSYPKKNQNMNDYSRKNKEKRNYKS